MRRVLGAALFIFLCPALQTQGENDPFPPFTIKGLQYRIPVDNNDIAEKKLAINLDARMPGFSTILKFTGKKRPLPAERKAKIELLKTMSQLSRMLPLYENEIEVFQDGIYYWLPIQKSSEEAFEIRVKPNSEFNAKIRYIGCCYTLDTSLMNQNRLYYLIGFDDDLSSRPTKRACFSNQLLGVKLGENMKDVLDKLSKKYGDPDIGRNDSGGVILQFHLNPKKTARLHVSSATVDYPRKVFLVQVSGSNFDQTLFDKVKLGQPLSRLTNVDHTKLKEEPTTTNTRTFFEEGSPCSVQTIEEKIQSVQIVEDSNFLSE